MSFDLDSLTSRVQCGQGFIRYEPAACNGCGKCSVSCVANLWSMQQGIAQLSREYQRHCLECGPCFHTCPTGAIDFHYPDSGAGVVYLHG